MIDEKRCYIGYSEGREKNDKGFIFKIRNSKSTRTYPITLEEAEKLLGADALLVIEKSLMDFVIFPLTNNRNLISRLIGKLLPIKPTLKKLTGLKRPEDSVKGAIPGYTAHKDAAYGRGNLPVEYKLK